MRFSPHFQLFYFNDRLEFCDFFLMKDQKNKQCRFIFSHICSYLSRVPILVEGTVYVHVCIYIYMCVCIYIFFPPRSYIKDDDDACTSTQF